MGGRIMENSKKYGDNVLLWFKNEEKYINASTLTSFFQSMLNAAFGEACCKVYLNSISEIGENVKYPCTLKLTIEPFSLAGANCETVNIRLALKYPTEEPNEKLRIINTLNQVIGPTNGEFTITDEGEEVKYTFFSDFKLREPSSDPEIINGTYRQTLSVEGNMHITRAGGGLIADMVKTYIVIGENKYEVIFRMSEDTLSVNTNTPLKVGSLIPDTEFLSLSPVKALIILYRNDYICNLIRDVIRGDCIENPFVDSNTGKLKMRVIEEYPDKTIDKEYFVYTMKESKERGVYVTLNVALMLTPPSDN
jgi:hypothetical protein